MNNLKTLTSKPSKLKLHDSEEEEEDDNERESLSSDEEEQEDEIERELADVTFEELHKARSDGSHSFHQKDNKVKTKRANKNMPMEASCNKPVGRFREVIQAPKKVIRDPRFESLCGDLNTEGFRKRYNFLYEETLPREKAKLRKRLKKSHSSEVVEDIKSQVSWIDKQLKSGSTQRKETAILTDHKRKERMAAKQGKQPFYLKKSEIRKLRNVEKFNELKAAGPGKVEAFMEKRRRKNAARDHRHIPYRRPNSDE